MTYLIPKAEPTYSPLLEAYGLARVMYRLSEDRSQQRKPDVQIRDIGWAYAIEPPVGLDVESSLKKTGRFGPVQALQRDGNLRMVVESQEQVSKLPVGMAITFNDLLVMQQLRRAMGYAPITSYERLRSIGFYSFNTAGYGYQKTTLQSVIRMPPEEFACRLRELLKTFIQGSVSELTEHKGEQISYVKPFYPNLLQGAAGIKARNSGFEKSGVKGPLIRQWLAIIGYFQAAVPINSGDDRIILIPEAQDLNLNQLAEVTDQVVKEVWGLNGNTYSRAVAMTRIYQLLIARGQTISGFLATTFTKINQSSFRPSGYDCHRLPKVFQSAPVEQTVMYKRFNQVIRPLEEVAHYQNRIKPNWANTVVEYLSTSYLMWLTSASPLNLLAYVIAVNQSCFRAKIQKRPAPFWTFNPELLKEVLLMTSRYVRNNEFLRKSVAGEDARFNNLARMIRNITTWPILNKKQKNEEKQPKKSIYYIQHDPQYNLITQLMTCVRNREEFRRILLYTVAVYNNESSKKYAALLSQYGNDSTKLAYPQLVKQEDLTWIYDPALEDDEDESIFEEAALLLLAYGTCVSKRSDAVAASDNFADSEDINNYMEVEIDV